MRENISATIKEIVSVRETVLQQMIEEKQQALRCAGADRLHASPHRRTVQFYRILPDGSKEYLRSGSPWIPQLAQKEYDQNVLKAAEQEEKLLSKLAAFYDRREDPESQYEKMLPAKRLYVEPVWEPDDEYVRKWLARPYTGLKYPEEYTDFVTDHGEKMRSKSEMIIANLLRKKGIPYRYECPLDLIDAENHCVETVYPDFTILRVRDRQKLYWEHLGLLEKPNYFKRNLRKIQLYEMNGYLPGQKLIVTYETSFVPLNVRLLDQMIEAYCR